ncbi:hypothetical protein IDEKMECI_00097 [Klebsiella phage vB_Kpn_B01]|uniref:Uncharacterized protein n=1 Tax=Klebsiella phage vB_Kpn_B01 TaxID=2736185 RepID=A0A6M5CE44_9CAUD|nr:hypothetical protein IDEKMECI_00097 [Klebsiella phage vB_Kpn_B01]
MAFKIEYLKKDVLTELVIDANMARNEGTKTVFYKDGSVARMINTEDIQDLYVISDEEAGFVKDPEPEEDTPSEEPPVEDTHTKEPPVEGTQEDEAAV